MDRSNRSFALALSAAFGLALFVTVLTAAVVLGQSSSGEDGVSKRDHCTGAPFDDPLWEDPDENCGHAPPTPAPPTATPCNRDPVTLECLPPPEPTATDPPEPTATDPPEPTATDPPEPTATDPPEPTATDPPEPTATDPPEPTATATPDATPACPSISDRSYQVGAAVTLSLPAATGGDGTLSYSVSGLPAGLSSSGSPPIVSGTPTTAGNHTVTYQAEDADGDTCEEEFDITITDPPTPETPPTATPTPGGTPTPLEAPTGLTSRPHSTGKIVLEWDASKVSGVSYQVQQKRTRRFLPDGQWRTLASGLTTATSVVADNLEYVTSYKHKVRVVVGGANGNRYSDWSEELDTTTPLPHFGRQADHRVQYELDSSVMGTAIPTAIADARIAWQTSGALSISSPVSFCLKSEGGCGDPVDDGRTVIIRSMAPTSRYSYHYTPDLPIPDCGPFSSCIGARLGDPLEIADKSGYVKDLEMRIEYPGHSYDPGADINYYFEWTSKPDEHLLIIPNSYRLYYLPMVLMHEFGHALGLQDLYRSPFYIEGYLMSGIKFGDLVTAIPDDDIDYLRDVYRNHTPQALPATP